MGEVIDLWAIKRMMLAGAGVKPAVEMTKKLRELERLYEDLAEIARLRAESEALERLTKKLRAENAAKQWNNALMRLQNEHTRRRLEQDALRRGFSV